MKKFLLVTLLFIFSNTALCQFGYDISPYRQKNPSHYEKEKKQIIESNIKSLSVSRVHYGKAEAKIDTTLWMYYEYDEKGNELLFEMFSESTGQPDGFLKMKYDSRNNETEIVDYDYNGSDFFMKDSTVTIYDESNKIKFSFKYNQDRQLEAFGFYVYDNKGNVQYSEFSAINRSYFSSEKFVYDKKSQLTFSIETKKNIANSNIVIDTIYPKDKEDDRLNIELNKKGNITKYIDDNFYQTKLEFRFQYDYNDNVIEKSYYENDKFDYKVLYQYNIFNLLEKETVYDEKGKILNEILYKYGFKY